MLAREQKNRDASCVVGVKYFIDGREQLIEQDFHRSYFDEEGNVKNTFLAVARQTHKELYLLADQLGLEYGKGMDPNLEMLCTCREVQKTRLARLRNVLIALSTGTFSFVCQKGQCPQFSSCPQDRDLTEERIIVPEATACVWFRKAQERIPVPHAKREAFF